MPSLPPETSEAILTMHDYDRATIAEARKHADAAWQARADLPEHLRLGYALFAFAGALKMADGQGAA